jgi:hypothetical protein
LRSPRPASESAGGLCSLHQIKHHGFRVVARKDGERIKL